MENPNLPNHGLWKALIANGVTVCVLFVVGIVLAAVLHVVAVVVAVVLVVIAIVLVAVLVLVPVAVLVNAWKKKKG